MVDKKPSSVLIPLIYILSLLLLLTTCEAEQAEAKTFNNYYVDWPTSKSGQYHIVRVGIEDCEMTFKIQDKDLDKFSKDDNAKKSLIKAAISKYNNNCKD